MSFYCLMALFCQSLLPVMYFLSLLLFKLSTKHNYVLYINTLPKKCPPDEVNATTHSVNEAVHELLLLGFWPIGGLSSALETPPGQCLKRYPVSWENSIIPTLTLVGVITVWLKLYTDLFDQSELLSTVGSIPSKSPTFTCKYGSVPMFVLIENYTLFVTVGWLKYFSFDL